MVVYILQGDYAKNNDPHAWQIVDVFSDSEYANKVLNDLKDSSHRLAREYRVLEYPVIGYQMKKPA